jgi:hypothetical protein
MGDFFTSEGGCLALDIVQEKDFGFINLTGNWAVKLASDLVSTMNATGPTTRPAFSVYKLSASPLDPATPRPWFLGGLDPADPFIAREWCDALPRCSRCWGRS